MADFICKVSPSLQVNLSDGSKVRFVDGKAEASGKAADELRKVDGVEEVKPAKKPEK